MSTAPRGERHLEKRTSRGTFFWTIVWAGGLHRIRHGRVGGGEHLMEVPGDASGAKRRIRAKLSAGYVERGTSEERTPDPLTLDAGPPRPTPPPRKPPAPLVRDSPFGMPVDQLMD